MTKPLPMPHSVREIVEGTDDELAKALSKFRRIALELHLGDEETVINAVMDMVDTVQGAHDIMQALIANDHRYARELLDQYSHPKLPETRRK